MRHRKQGQKFHRTSGRRRSFLRNLANDLIRAQRIETTEARAKAVRPIVEKLITLAKKQTLASRRLVLARVINKRIASKLCDDLRPAMLLAPGGYVRITKLALSRKRDGGSVALIEFV